MEMELGRGSSLLGIHKLSSAAEGNASLSWTFGTYSSLDHSG